VITRTVVSPGGARKVTVACWHGRRSRKVESRKSGWRGSEGVKRGSGGKHKTGAMCVRRVEGENLGGRTDKDLEDSRGKKATERRFSIALESRGLPLLEPVDAETVLRRDAGRASGKETGRSTHRTGGPLQGGSDEVK